MAKLKERKAITSITQQTYGDPAIRKDCRSSVVIDRGVRANNTEEFCGALIFDFWHGKMDSAQLSGLLAAHAVTLKREDQNIKLKELSLHATLREQIAIRLEDRRARIEGERFMRALEKETPADSGE